MSTTRKLAHGHRGFDRRRSESYDRTARWTLGGLYRRVAAEVAAAAPAGGLVLDVGTGPGRLLHGLAALRGDLTLTGVDVSPDMIAVGERAARERGLGDQVALRVADVAALPFEDASVDVVVSTLSMHHWPDLAAAAAELARVLRPGGQIMIYDFRFAPVDRALEALRAQPAFAHGRAVREPMRGRFSPFPLYVCLRGWIPA
ncbi:class I SAM-dependent methyltransferase [Streptomyces specialis]|uniref:class I SAM-dependent methyltransferase n=1 Tax=Streptomyces specialis TaxID=498367 RepID=UPI00073F2C83|nr:class I SAM-dependent methyltransferase [Streptomyces specialis]